MYSQSWQESNVLFRLKLLKDRLAKWESGEKYIQLQKEHSRELAKKDQELRKMEARMFEAFRQRDEAMEKYRKKNLELYDVMTQLEEVLGKNLELTARVNKDYTNSSKSSSMSPNHKTIQNNREKTERRPGGQPGHPHHERKRQEPDRILPGCPHDRGRHKSGILDDCCYSSFHNGYLKQKKIS